MAQDPWAGFEEVGPSAPAQPEYPSIIRGAPKPVSPLQINADARADRSLELQEQNAALTQQLTGLTIAEKQAKLAEEAEKQRLQGDAKTAASRDLARTLRQINAVALDAADNGGLFETGTSGAIARAVLPEGQAGSDLSAALKPIIGTTAFDALVKLKAAGGALGALSDTELDLLATKTANLDPNQSHKQFLQSLNDVHQKLFQALQEIDPAAAEELKTAPGFRYNEDGTGYLTAAEGADKRPVQDPLGFRGDPGGGGGGIVQGLAEGTGDAIEGAAAIPGMLINPIGQALYNATGYGDQTYDLGDILRGAVGAPESAPGIGRSMRQGAAAALTGGGIARGVGAVTSGVAGRVANTLGRTPIRDTAAGAGAGAGMEVGGDVGGTTGAIVGTLAGGIGGYAGANRLARFGQGQPNALASAAQDLNITMTPADAGGAGARMATGMMGRTLGGIPIAEGATNALASAGRATRNVADRVGTVTDEAGAGQAVRRGAKDFTESSSARESALFERVSVPAESKVQLNQTRDSLMEITKGFKSNPELSRLWANHPRLKKTLEALTPTDTRPAGRVKYEEVADSVRSAERDLYELRSGNITLAKLKLDAQEGLAQARKAFDALPLESTPASTLSRARTQLANAEARNQRLSALSPDENGVAALERQLKQKLDSRDEAFVEARQPPMGGELSWKDMARFRSIVGEIIGRPGVTSDGSDIAAMRRLYASLTADMEATAAASGPRALQEWKRAVDYSRGRHKRIDDVFATLFGNKDQKSDEAVFRQLQNWGKEDGGDFNRLARTIRSLPKDEADTVRATLIQRMGLARKASQEGDGEVFSAKQWAGNWHGMSGRAKAVLFPNKEHRADLDKLALVLDNMKQADQFQNYSNTAAGANAIALTGIGATASPVAAALAAAAQYAGGMLLASPAVARVLARTSRMPPEAQGRALDKQLAVIAESQAGLAPEINALRSALNDNMGVSAAAGNPEENQRQK